MLLVLVILFPGRTSMMVIMIITSLTIRGVKGMVFVQEITIEVYGFR